MRIFQVKDDEDEEFETLEDIANFINSSEPLHKEPTHGLT